MICCPISSVKMTDPLAPLSTDPNDFIWIDVETRSTEDVTVHGAYRHNANGRVTIVAYAIGDGEVQDWCLPSFAPGLRLHWKDAPPDLAAALERVQAGEAWVVAHNCNFEFNAFTRAMDGLPDFKVEWLLDSAVQAVRSHLPVDLAGAARKIGLAQKQGVGKSLIKMFAIEGNEFSPQSHPVEWDQFRSYARDDVAAMRDVFNATLPLSRQEWREFWASERINHRGAPVDVEFLEGAAALAATLTERANADIKRLTDGQIRTVNQSAALLDWTRFTLRALPEVDRILTREVVLEPGDDGEDVATAKHSLERTRVEELIAYLERVDSEQGLTDDEFKVMQVLEVRLYGASATPKKFAKAARVLDMGGVRNIANTLKGQYAFNGAAATGRYSSRGVQVHNLTRATIGGRRDELAAIEMITERGAACFDDLQTRWGPVGRTLSRLVRPIFLAERGQMFVWSDWSAIEARALPWLAGSEGAEAVLDVFRQNDLDPSLPDIYKVQAGKILGKPASEVTKAERQSHGKVPVLSLGYGGGVGALFNMARAYGASFTEEEAKEIVWAWRGDNKWAKRFWDDLWEATLWCMENPDEPRMAGRVTFLFDPDYMRGTLFCVLPCGRPLLYPRVRWSEVEDTDKKTGEKRKNTKLTYARGNGWGVLWGGLQAENVTQAAAASLLRAALVRLDTSDEPDVILSTHDEIVAMCPEGRVEWCKDRLEAAMREAPPWAEGLPLAVESSVAEYYTKTAE
jgi:DNA polymerase